MKKIHLILCLVFLICLLAGCGTDAGETLPPETQPVTHSVGFYLNNTELSRQSVAENGLPQPLTETPAGVQITGWLDGQNQPVDPFATAVTTDTVYHAVFYPQLTNHVPFLFVNEAGLLLPDEPLTQADFTQAINALAAAGAADYLPAMTGEAVPMTHSALTAALSHFFDETAVTAAFHQIQDPTRSVFAAGMCQLLGRDATETLTAEDAAVIPLDVTADRPDAAALLEAAIPHTPDDAGVTWAELELPTAYEPGFVLQDGNLLYVQEDHCLLRDGYVGTLYFDATGRYTSGDATLDATVTALLKGFAEENPEADRFALLRVVYDHCHQNYTYRRTFDHPEYGSTGWEIQRANAMFETTKGNCYSYAAIFWALSRQLGYDTRAISGKVLEDEQPHSWCIIELDGEDFIFDPQWQYNYTERGIFHYDMFQIPMDKATFWLYQWTE